MRPQTIFTNNNNTLFNIDHIILDHVILLLSPNKLPPTLSIQILVISLPTKYQMPRKFVVNISFSISNSNLPRITSLYS